MMHVYCHFCFFFLSDVLNNKVMTLIKNEGGRPSLLPELMSVQPGCWEEATPPRGHVSVGGHVRSGGRRTLFVASMNLTPL